MAAAAASSSSPSTLTVTVSPCLTPMPIRAISLRRSQVLPFFSRVAVLEKPLTTLTSRPAGRAWMPQASFDSVLKFLHDHFSLLGIPFIMLRGHRPRRRQPNPAAGYTTYIINLIRCFFIIPFR